MHVQLWVQVFLEMLDFLVVFVVVADDNLVVGNFVDIVVVVVVFAGVAVVVAGVAVVVVGVAVLYIAVVVDILVWVVGIVTAHQMVSLIDCGYFLFLMIPENKAIWFEYRFIFV